MSRVGRRTGSRQARPLVRAYPLPFIALAGMGTGVAFALFGDGDAARAVWYGTLVVGGLPVVAKTVRGALKRKFAADLIAMLAIVTAILTDEAFAGVVIVLMQTGGEAIDDYGFRRASSSLEELIARAPRLARRRRSDALEEVRVEEVKIGDALVVRPGDLVPVDGSVASEPAEVDESALTGEPLPKSKFLGDKLLSGSVNVGPLFEMIASKESGKSQYSRIVELVKEAQGQKPPIQRLADRYAVWFTPITVAVALASLALTRSFDAFLAVLVVATPCPLILATPLAVISGVNRAAKEGIIVKSGAAIEQIGRGRVVIFDKTGTLTFGTPAIERVVPMGWEADAILKLAASVEQYSTHPVAVSVAKAGRERFGGLLPARDFAEAPGRGVRAKVDGASVVLGSQTYVEQAIGGRFDAGSGDVLEEAQAKGKLVSFVAVDGRPAGIIVFSDQLRPGVPAMLLKLRELGVEQAVMLTGDCAANAETVAKEAGIEKAEANLLPQQKVDEVRKLTEEFGSSIMVGDGINDAPALVAATVGVAMGAHGTGISAEAADVVLLVDDVTKVGDGIAIGQRMLHIAKQSIFFGMGGSFVLMVVASFGYIQPAIGAVMQEALDITVILNALRVR
ncbi:MAG: heavy metal translocating P-type ATPase [Nitrososphaerota archaeon]|nr:heavy metal translocating P-type ATPase [Nitrososphaerota archaeon]